MKKLIPNVYILNPPHSVVDLITNSSSELFVLGMPNMSKEKIEQIIQRFNTLHKTSKEAGNEVHGYTMYGRGVFDVFKNVTFMKKSLLQHVEDLPPDLRTLTLNLDWVEIEETPSIYNEYERMHRIFVDEFGYLEHEYDVIEVIIDHCVNYSGSYDNDLGKMVREPEKIKDALASIVEGSVLLRGAEDNYTNRELFDEMFAPFKIKEFMI